MECLRSSSISPKCTSHLGIGLVMDESELEDDLVRDVTEVMTSLCARLYGRRSARRRAERALAAAEEGL